MSKRVYAGKDVAVEITKTTSGDMGAYIAQELTLEPKQDVESIDGLGDTSVQAWGFGNKSFEGSLKEMLETDNSGANSILERLSAFQTDPEEYTMTVTFENVDGTLVLTFTGVIFPEPSISIPKGKSAVITTKFRAKTASKEWTPGS